MSAKELQEELHKVVDNSNQVVLEKLLQYAKDLANKQSEYQLDDLDKRILKENDNLFRRLAE